MSKLNRSFLTTTSFVSTLLERPRLGVIVWRMASCQTSDQVVPKEEVVRFICECLCKAGTTAEDGQVVGHHLMTADYNGHFSHGMNRLRMYVQDIQCKVTDPVAKPRVVTDFQVWIGRIFVDETVPRPFTCFFDPPTYRCGKSVENSLWNVSHKERSLCETLIF